MKVLDDKEKFSEPQNHSWPLFSIFTR